MATRAKARQANQSRPSRRATRKRLTISLPEETLDRVRKEANTSGAPSLSAYITEMLEERFEHQSFRDILREIFTREPITEDERAWVDSLFNR